MTKAEAAEPDAPTLALRIALHMGVVTATEHDIYGQGVNVAARVPRPPDVSPLPSLAVLPLRNLGGDPQDDYFADGVVDDIVVSLGNLRELMVVSRSSTLAWRGQEGDLRAVSRALGVRYLVTGSVRRSGRELRVQVELVDAQSGTRLWGDRAEATGGELFALQDRIVERIVAGVVPHVRAAELRRAMRKRPESFTAYDLTLRGIALIHDLSPDRFAEAGGLLERAMAHDPGFAPPAAWAARWHSVNVGQGWSGDPRADLEQAAALSARAIELDRQNAVALATHAHLRSFLFHDDDTALVFFERALSAWPNSALAWLLSSATLSYVGRTEEAIRQAEHGLRLSPFDRSLFSYCNLLGLAHYAHGDMEQAIRWYRLSFAEMPSFTATLRVFAAALAASDRAEEAREIAARLLAIEPGVTLSEYQRTRQPFRDERIRARLIRDLRAAGLPA